MIKLYEKLYKIQQLALAVSKDWKNPHFKSAYPTLDNTISVIIPEINKIGLLVTHFGDKGYFVTRVTDIESGEFLDSTYETKGQTPQQIGSEQTYFRRYSMIALFNLPCEDDDGNAGSNYAPPAFQNTPKVWEPTEPSEWIDKAKIAKFIEKLKSGELVAGSQQSAVALARKYYKVSKENADLIMQEFSKHII